MLGIEPGPTVTPFLAKGGKAVSVLGNSQLRWGPVYREDSPTIAGSVATTGSVPMTEDGLNPLAVR